MKDFQVIYRFAVGYGANLRYTGLRRTYLVTASSAAQAYKIAQDYTCQSYGTGLYKGWMVAVKHYNGTKQTRTFIDLREIQTKEVNQ
jgi:hypothetical protein